MTSTMKLVSICRRRKALLYVVLVFVGTLTILQVIRLNLGPSISSKHSKRVLNRRQPHLLRAFSSQTQSIDEREENPSIHQSYIKNSTREKSVHPYINITKECFPLADPSTIKTPFKFFIYDLPPKFNKDIRVKMSTEKMYAYCYNLNYCGAGEEFYQYTYHKGEQLYHDQGREVSQPARDYFTSVRNTHQFALEVTIHHKLMHSPYRTMDPTKADIFYIPAYTGLTCLSERSGGNAFVKELFTYMREQLPQYFLSGKPHFSTLSKIQREQGSTFCNTLKHPDTANITFIAIEKESNPYWANKADIHGKSIIVAPYPSYIHFIPHMNKSVHMWNKVDVEFNPNITDLIKNTEFHLHVPSLAERNIKLFLASSSRRSNTFRAKIIDQFRNKTKDSFETFFRNYVSDKSTETLPTLSDIMLITPECSSSHRTTTIPWMHKSIFCLQPPGDSPTRKSFYDSILSGCIPVIFSLKHKTEYPFEKWLNYSKFTFTIDEKLATKNGTRVLDIIQGIQQTQVQSMHQHLLKVAKWFQYSMNDGSIDTDTDAVTLILQQLKELYKL